MFTPPPHRRPTLSPIAPLLDTNITLPDGGRVRLRLPQARDRRGVTALLERVGVGTDALDLQRALRFDPRERAVVCATRWTADGERVVGLGAITFGADRADLLLVDEALAPGLGATLHGTLEGVSAQRRAA
jgi:hypothetical protein